MPARFYVPKHDWATNLLSEEEAHHAIKVMRVKTGENIELFDGEGTIATASVTSISGKSLEYTIESEKTLTVKTPSINLYQAIPKGKNMELIIQKAVELGVTEIIPLITKNTVAVSDSPEKKALKWQRTALEACKQCRQAFLPKIHTPVQFTESLKFYGELKVVGALRPNQKPLRETFNSHAPQSVSILVGPEGDFTDSELHYAESSGFIPVTLGDLVLRVETATLYMISATRFFYSK